MQGVKEMEAKPEVNLIHDALTDHPVESWFHMPMWLAKAYEIQSFFEGVAAYHRLTGNARALAATEARSRLARRKCDYR